MACALGTPKGRPESGVYWFRKRAPDRLKAKVGKSEIKFSLRTRDPDIARLRNLEAMVKIERAWAGCRADVTANEITATPCEFMGTVKRQASILAHVAVVTDVAEIGELRGRSHRGPIREAAK
jgi:hypothetical protein